MHAEGQDRCQKFELQIVAHNIGFLVLPTTPPLPEVSPPPPPPDVPLTTANNSVAA